MDNKQDRQFYWEVKDFMNKKANPQPLNSSKPKITDAVKNVLEQNNTYTQKSFNNKSEYVPYAQKAIESISAAEKGYKQNCKALTRNDISNPFSLNEGLFNWFDSPTAGDYQDKQKKEEEDKKNQAQQAQQGQQAQQPQEGGGVKGIIDTIQDVGDWVSIGAGFIPVVGQGIAAGIDSISAAVDLGQGDYEDSAWRAGSAALSFVPVGGSAAKLTAKLGRGAAQVAKGADAVGSAVKAVRGAEAVGSAAAKVGADATEALAKGGADAVGSLAAKGGSEAAEAAGKVAADSGEALTHMTQHHSKLVGSAAPTKTFVPGKGWVLNSADDIAKAGAKVGAESLQAGAKTATKVAAETLEAGAKGATKFGDDAVEAALKGTGKGAAKGGKIVRAAKAVGKAAIVGGIVNQLIGGEGSAQRKNSFGARQMGGGAVNVGGPAMSSMRIGQYSSGGRIA